MDVRTGEGGTVQFNRSMAEAVSEGKAVGLRDEIDSGSLLKVTGTPH
jgi:hypothetical protein